MSRSALIGLPLSLLALAGAILLHVLAWMGIAPGRTLGAVAASGVVLALMAIASWVRRPDRDDRAAAISLTRQATRYFGRAVDLLRYALLAYVVALATFEAVRLHAEPTPSGHLGRLVTAYARIYSAAWILFAYWAALLFATRARMAGQGQDSRDT